MKHTTEPTEFKLNIDVFGGEVNGMKSGEEIIERGETGRGDMSSASLLFERFLTFHLQPTDFTSNIVLHTVLHDCSGIENGKKLNRRETGFILYFKMQLQGI